jgi:hypothetical protein
MLVLYHSIRELSTWLVEAYGGLSCSLNSSLNMKETEREKERERERDTRIPQAPLRICLQ